MSPLTYLAIAAVIVMADAMLCLAVRRRFRPSLFLLVAVLLWPITIPLVVGLVAYVTRKLPEVNREPPVEIMRKID